MIVNEPSKYEERFKCVFGKIQRDDDLFEMVEKGLKDYPPKLYRYRKLSFHTALEIGNQEIFLASPNIFDDVFDSKFYWQNKIPCLKNNEQLMLENRKNAFIRELNEYANQNMRIASFSDSNNNIPLWYYYADNNRGICIEYDMNTMPAFQDKKYVILPVIYPSHGEADNYRMSSVDPQNIKTIALRNTLIKNYEWRFENEWRMVRFSEDSESNYFQMNISAIYVGWDMDKGTLEKLRQYVQRSLNDIPIQMMYPTVNGLKPYSVN